MKTMVRFINQGYTVTPGAYKALLSLETNVEKREYCKFSKPFYNFLLGYNFEDKTVINKVDIAKVLILFLRNEKNIQILGYENPSYRKFFIEDTKDDGIDSYKEYYSINIGCGFATDTLRDIYMLSFQSRHMGLDIGSLELVCHAILSKYFSWNDGIIY